MNRSLKCFVLLTSLIFVSTSAAAEPSSIIAPDAEVTLLAEGFIFTEGPASDAEGNVYFTDQPNDQILRWSTEGKLSTFMKPCGRSNGLCFDTKGDLWACADEKNELWRIDPEGNKTVVIDNYEGELLNGPNDVWISPSGLIYFTNPYYKRPYWTRTVGPQNVKGAYCYDPKTGKTTCVADDLVQSNGLIGTPCGRTLYITDLGAKKTYAYDIKPDGTLGGKRLFCEMGSDGMTIDNRGNVYLTGRGVTVFNPKGEQIEQIDVPEGWTANVCFGGKDRATLFITAKKGLYGLKMSVRGVGSQ